ncbi:aminodeoxychorismate synthase component I [Epilithonimonas ginsengisoli]|uniref:Aminodeoxychorismate synthase component I n=1 Tax=Epilithonimonas ginsengisoli TaxID=1245592 RepID=A0ABU4JE93_9FLAO|nr:MULTISPECIES: aminodeoxychorismate synthase component I [Chryseobacterium group]MBV6879329.1 aminodeoxychorismate synthase component I [Epilithonimonas sp. FP105]MDW8547974.1 aminodeoxychorismate synthase component I [Epilithonimonas ginsengisoli]OAH73104.1 aminobenzoate synthetase [Chryseobacterium sp. FP211-J200]
MFQNPQFQRMDELSERKEPFFFLINFLMDEVRIFTQNEIKNNSLSIDFPNVKNVIDEHAQVPNFGWKSFPETLEDYQKGFEIVQENLKKGNSYLTNYTRKTEIETNLTLEDIFKFSKAKYKILVPDEFVCFSPETFIEIVDNKIFTHPMKGTIDAEIEDAENILKNDPKEKAEHYTVVDLLRNDLSMVANNVRVKDFQRIDYLKTKQKNLLAMSSEIEGEIKPEFQNKIGSILQKLLPAGSILGAPKPKTLEIILKAEKYDRGFYTGIAGYFDGKNLDSCVMIRFIEKENRKLFFKSGGGITHQSDLISEYEEMKNKIYVPIY